jgi:hypothetical protein
MTCNDHDADGVDGTVVALLFWPGPSCYLGPQQPMAKIIVVVEVFKVADAEVTMAF